MTVLVVLVVFTAMAGLLVVSSVVNGYVLSILWGWFVVPVFNLPPLSVVPAIGLAMVLSYLTHQMPPDCVEKEQSKGQKAARAAGYLFLKPLLALLFGWIVHSFM